VAINYSIDIYFLILRRLLNITASITHFAISVGLLCEWISQYKDGHVSVKPTEWPGRIIRIKREITVLVSRATFLYSLSKWLSSIRSYFNGVIAYPYLNNIKVWPYSNMGRHYIHEYLTPSESEELNLMNIMPTHI
jgi:hypothetical protein